MWKRPQPSSALLEHASHPHGMDTEFLIVSIIVRIVSRLAHYRVAREGLRAHETLGFPIDTKPTPQTRHPTATPKFVFAVSIATFSKVCGASLPVTLRLPCSGIVPNGAEGVPNPQARRIGKECVYEVDFARFGGLRPLLRDARHSFSLCSLDIRLQERGLHTRDGPPLGAGGGDPEHRRRAAERVPHHHSRLGGRRAGAEVAGRANPRSARVLPHHAPAHARRP
eukprot:6270-Prorocentrum_minimum.AAC.2